MVGKKRGTQHANLRETKAIDYVLFTCRLRVVYVSFTCRLRVLLGNCSKNRGTTKSGKPLIGITAFWGKWPIGQYYFNLSLPLSMGTLQINLSHLLSLLLTLSVQNS